MEAFLAQAHKTVSQRPTVFRLLDVIYDFVGAMKPFISQEISFFNVPHYYILKLGLGGKCTAQYKLRSGTPHLLPREPKDARELVRVTSCLVADDFALVDGKLELLKFMDCDITDRDNYSTGQFTTAIALEGCLDIFKKLQTETFQLMDMKARLEANTEDEIDGPSFSYEDLKRASSDKYGYICFLKDSVEGPFRIPVIPPIIHGDEVYGGNATQRSRTEKGAAEIFAAKQYMLEAISKHTFEVSSLTSFPAKWFASSTVYQHEVDYFSQLGTEADIIAAAAAKAKSAPLWGTGLIYPDIEVTTEMMAEQASLRELYSRKQQMANSFIAALSKKGQMIESDLFGQPLEQVRRPGLIAPTPSEAAWDPENFAGKILFYFIFFLTLKLSLQ